MRTLELQRRLAEVSVLLEDADNHAANGRASEAVYAVTGAMTELVLVIEALAGEQQRGAS
jgi:hypothetical protein